MTVHRTGDVHEDDVAHTVATRVGHGAGDGVVECGEHHLCRRGGR